MTRATLKFLSELLDRVTIGASDPEFEQLAAAISLARRELNQALDAGDITRAEPGGPLPLAPAAPDEQPAAVLAVPPPEPAPAPDPLAAVRPSPDAPPDAA